MKLTDMLKKEIKTIEKSDMMNAIPMIRDDCVAVMVCCMFKDGRMHHILPPKEFTLRFTSDLVKLLETDENWLASQKNFEKQKIEPMFDEKEFKL